MNNNTAVRFRCSLYNHSVKDEGVSKEVVLTSWKGPSRLVGPVELLVDPSTFGKYTLHHQSEKKLAELGYFPRGESDGSHETTSQHGNLPDLEDGFYEVEDIMERRICKTTLGYEYKVHFKGYSLENDMWLPSCYFNRSIHLGMPIDTLLAPLCVILLTATV